MLPVPGGPIGGQQERLGEAPISLGGRGAAAGDPALGRRVVLKADNRGHFIERGQINGKTMVYMVDTGASSVAIGRSDAERMGLPFLKGQPVMMRTANGDAIGTTGADTLTGTSGANQIVAGDGNDTLVGAGGADVLYGGRGNDTLVVNGSNITALATNNGNAAQAIARIDGGSGTDTLASRLPRPSCVTGPQISSRAPATPSSIVISTV